MPVIRGSGGRSPPYTALLLLRVGLGRGLGGRLWGGLVGLVELVEVFQGLGGLVERVLQELVLVLVQGVERDLEGLGVLEEAAGADGLEADTGVVVGNELLQRVERGRHAVAPVAEDARGRGAGVRLG